MSDSNIERKISCRNCQKVLVYDEDEGCWRHEDTGMNSCYGKRGGAIKAEPERP